MTNVTLIGRLTADATTGETANGNTFANFCVADTVNDETVYFHNCVAFGKVAEIIGKYAKKGTQVGVVGILTNREYIDKANVKRKITEILVNSVKLLGKATVEDKEKTEVEKKASTKVKAVKKHSEPTEIEMPF